MRRAARTDSTQADIVAALRAIGWGVADIHRHGAGVPDLLLYVPNRNLWLPAECKSATGTLTERERRWWAEMGAEPIIIRTMSEALAIVGVEVAS